MEGEKLAAEEAIRTGLYGVRNSEPQLLLILGFRVEGSGFRVWGWGFYRAQGCLGVFRCSGLMHMQSF